MEKSVGILIFDEVEVLDFCGPFEVLSVTRLNESRRREDGSPFRVHLVAERTEPVTAVGGLRVLPDFAAGDCPPLDILIVPGGYGTRKEMNNENLLTWIRERSAGTELTASVCTGALMLGGAGLLREKSATTHWGALDLLAEKFPETRVLRDKNVVEDGNLFTSAGISAGIEMALRIVERYHGESIARATAHHMEYTYPENDERKVAI